VNGVEKLGQFPEGKKLERGGSRGNPDPGSRTEYDKRRTGGRRTDEGEDLINFSEGVH